MRNRQASGRNSTLAVRAGRLFHLCLSMPLGTSSRPKRWRACPKSSAYRQLSAPIPSNPFLGDRSTSRPLIFHARRHPNGEDVNGSCVSWQWVTVKALMSLIEGDGALLKRPDIWEPSFKQECLRCCGTCKEKASSGSFSPEPPPLSHLLLCILSPYLRSVALSNWR